MRPSRPARILVAALTLVGLAGCGSAAEGPTTTTSSSSAPAAAQFPVTISHAFGETTIESQPERIATVAWANHEVPIALGVIPVGMSKATWGDDDGDGVLPWVEAKLSELGRSPRCCSTRRTALISRQLPTPSPTSSRVLLRPDPGGVRHPHQGRAGGGLPGPGKKRLTFYHSQSSRIAKPNSQIQSVSSAKRMRSEPMFIALSD